MANAQTNGSTLRNPLRLWPGVDLRRCSSRSIMGATALLLCATVVWTEEQSPVTAAIEWHQDPGQVMDLAREEGKPILIDFWATWCPPCRQMEFHLWSRPDVVRLADKFVFLRVDVDRLPEIARRYRAEALPTVILSDPWGTEIARREGFGSAGEYLDILNAMPVDFSEVAPWQGRLADDPRDVQALREIGLAYHRMKLFQISSDFLERALAARDARTQPEALAELHTVIGWNNLKTGHFKRAIKSFKRCLKEVPDHPALDVTLYGLMAAYLADGERRKAEPLLAQLESCCPESTLTLRAHAELQPRVAQGE